MRVIMRILALSIAILALTASAAWATHTVYAPNYPTLSQLESGWNAAFVSWLTAKYGGIPVITSTTTYIGQDGQIFVVSAFTVGTTSGRILGRAFDPKEATPLGNGVYQYQVKTNGAFTCQGVQGCTECQPHERHYEDGSYERWCSCEYFQAPAGCTLTPAEDFAGSYQIKPGDYSTLPTIN